SRKSPGRSRGTECGGYHIFINEFAPRPHNSGHITRNACNISQFDALARILVGVPLTQPVMRGEGGFCMGNLLGDVWLTQGNEDLDLSSLKDHPDVLEVVIYGKPEARAKRKMGHFVTFGKDAGAAATGAKSFRESLTRRSPASRPV